MRDHTVVGVTLEALRHMSARIGRNADLIQAGGGNTSIKLDGTLWIKASGKWLISADREEMFLPVPLDAINACIGRKEEYNTEYNGLRPSVETTLHAVLPHRCVIHVHSVNVLAWASLADSPTAFAQQLDGIRWAWIPYIHPGLPLALAIRDRLASSPDVVVMQNHGLIVGGETCESTEALLYHVERRLDLPMRVAPPPRVNELRQLAGPGWNLAADGDTHALGTDPDSYRVATAGTMYPDHCVYLGHSLAACPVNDQPEAAAVRYQQQWGRRPSALACEGLGVLTDPALSRAGREMLTCLSGMVRRIPSDAEVHYLDYEQVARLMNWDAEHYRQAMARRMEPQ